MKQIELTSGQLDKLAEGDDKINLEMAHALSREEDMCIHITDKDELYHLDAKSLDVSPINHTPTDLEQGDQIFVDGSVWTVDGFEKNVSVYSSNPERVESDTIMRLRRDD